jgi:hypothetical protein
MPAADPMSSCAVPASDPPALPWYRQPWPWLLIAGPAIVVVAAFVTAYLAWSTYDGVVAEDYYKRGLLINKSLERDARARAWGLGAIVRIDAGGAVRVDLSGSVPPTPALTLRLAHATRAGMDRQAVLTQGSDGAWRGRLAPPPAGRWLVSVETDAWRLAAAKSTGTPEEIRLGTARDAP